MIKYFLLCLSLVVGSTLFAQLPEDALRYSWLTPSGSARQQAIGGAMGSLGGEISSAYVNPAGLGLYKTSELVVSPGFYFQHGNADYRGTDTKGSSANNFNIGTSGFVFGFGGADGKSTSVFSLAVNRTANFGSNISYQGQNDYSSYSEQYVEEFINSHLTVDQALNSTQVSYGTRMALYSYLVDTASSGGDVRVFGQPEKVLAVDGALNQSYSSRSTGGITEIALSFGGSLRDKLYIGASLGIPIVNYTNDLQFTESDPHNLTSDFASFNYTSHYHTSGAGVNLKAGLIYRFTPAFRLGFAIHTPSWYTLTDHFSASMSTDTKTYTSQPQPINITSQDLDNGSGVSAADYRYYLSSPWHFLISGSYLFGGGLADIKQQKGFITADVEYVTTNSSRFGVADDYTDPSYYDGINSVVKSYYRGTFNLRLGGEIKLNTFALRLGGSYATDPYSNHSLKADRLYVTGGIGYRNKGVFVDLAYVQGFAKDVNFPYYLADKSNTYAALKQNSGTVVATFGIKF